MGFKTRSILLSHSLYPWHLYFFFFRLCPKFYFIHIYSNLFSWCGLEFRRNWYSNKREKETSRNLSIIRVTRKPAREISPFDLNVVQCHYLRTHATRDIWAVPTLLQIKLQSKMNQKEIRRKTLLGCRIPFQWEFCSQRSTAAAAGRHEPAVLDPNVSKTAGERSVEITTANAGTCRGVSSRVILQEPHWITFKRPIKNQPGNQTKQQKIMKFPRRSFFFVSIGSKFIGR